MRCGLAQTELAATCCELAPRLLQRLTLHDEAQRRYS
jgi:hypothetical protein